MSVIKKINITDPTTHITTLNPIGALAGDVDYDNTNSGLQADDVQEALDEIAANMGEGTAADTTYDNTESGLAADNVQDAIDEIDLTVDSLSSSVLSITGDINDIELDIANLSASIVSINNNINDINGDISDIELSISDLSSSVLSINGEIEDIELTIADLSASKLGYDNTQSGLSGDTIQEAIDELAGQDSGHTYKNDSGTSMTQRSNAKFNGVYVEDDSSNNTTNINIIREFQNDAEVQALTGEAAKGFQHTPDNVYRARSAADITFDPTNTLLTETRMQEAMEELDAEHLPYSSTQSTKQKIDEIVNNSEWKLLTSKQLSQAGSLATIIPATAKELYINFVALGLQLFIPTISLVQTGRYYQNGFYLASNNYGGIAVEVSKYTIGYATDSLNGSFVSSQVDIFYKE